MQIGLTFRLLALLPALTLLAAGCANGSDAHLGATSTPAPTPSPTVSTSPSPVGSASPQNVGALPAFFGPDFDPGASFCTFHDQVVAVSQDVLTVIYPAGSTAPSMGPPYGGAQICEPFSSGPRTSATLTYRVRFPNSFQFVRGGKLPGFYGGVEPFSGGGHNAQGWSARLMWRPEGAGEIYAYFAGTTGYGLQIGLGSFYWPANGQWQTVSLHVVINSPGQSNGQAVLSINGHVVIEAGGLNITTTATPIDGLFFSSFYGGHDPTWAPSAQTSIEFADFSAS
ncbi:MAG: polysaccharide lyase [Candidatus Dormiibacterota bacterium]